MGILDRLETVVKSYINDESEKLFGKNSSAWRQKTSNESKGENRKEKIDPDLAAAYEELDEFMHKVNGTQEKDDTAGTSNTRTQSRTHSYTRQIPEEIRQDLAEMGLSAEATAKECKEAYKRLLRIHHPDRHANHAGNLKKATEKTAKLNAAYTRLENWFRLQK